MTRLLCTGDLHIGAGRGLYPERLAEQQDVWRRILELAGERDCAAVLFAGDAFHRNHPDDDERHAFTAPLLESTVPVVAINGNSHDWRGQGRKMAVETAALGAGSLAVSTAPELVDLPSGVTLCTLPWTPVARLVADHDGGDRDDINLLAARLLIETARGLRARVDGDAILMGHWSVSGAALPSGLDVGQLREPVLPLDDLVGLGFDAIVMGHIHRAQQMYDAPPSFYVGSPMPLDFGEAQVDHGVWVLDTESWRAEFVPVESRRFVTVSLAELDGLELDDGPIVRVKDTIGAGDHRPGGDDECRRNLLADGAVHVQMAIDVARDVRRPRSADIAEDMGPAQQLAVWLRETESANGNLERLVERGRGYLEAVPFS